MKANNKCKAAWLIVNQAIDNLKKEKFNQK